jgi:hypothetical protein
MRKLLAAWALAFLFVGGLQAFVMPPFQVPDEPAHWMAGLTRIHQALQPRVPFCSSEVSYFNHYGMRPGIHHPPPSPDQVLPTCGSAEVSYGGLWSYPQLWVAHGLHGLWPLNPEITFRLARIVSGALLWLVLAITWSRALATHHPASMIGAVWAGLLLMSPVGIQQAFGVSSDGVVFAFGLMLASLLVSGDAWRRREWALFLTISICAVTTKAVVAPVVLIAFGFRQSLKRFYQKAAVVSVFAMGILSGLLSKAAVTNGPYGDAAAQKAFILSQPFETLGLLLKEAIFRALPYTQWLVGRLGWLDHTTNHLTLAIYFCSFIALARLGWNTLRQVGFRRVVSIRLHRHVIFAVLWVASACLIELFIYLAWNPPRSREISGLQGRYFIPLHMVAIGYLAASMREAKPSLKWEGAEGLRLEKGFVKVIGIHGLALIGMVWDLIGFYRS